MESGQWYQTHQDVNDGFGGCLLHAENVLIFEMIHDPEFFQRYVEEQTSDQLFKFELSSFSTITGLRLRFLRQADGIVLLNELHIHKPVSFNTSSE